jgi:hypothetical protein
MSIREKPPYTSLHRIQEIRVPLLSDPRTIPGCILWLDGADPAGTNHPPTDGTYLTSWKDKSVTGLTLTSDGAQYLATGLNGYPAINIGQALFTSYSGITYNWQEVFTVAVWNGGPNFADNARGLVTGALDGYPDGVGFEGGGGGDSFFTPQSWLQQPFYLNGTALEIYGNVFPTVQSPFLIRGANSEAVNVRGITLGNDRNNGGRVWIGYMAETVCFNRPLSVKERYLMEGYLAWKWGIQSTLPLEHPFRAAAPLSLKARGDIHLISPLHIFTFTGQLQYLKVPHAARYVYVYMWGAGGQGGWQRGNGVGGAGAMVQGVLSVVPGETLTIIVGEGGARGVYSAFGGGGYFPTGAADYSGGGGGRSAIQRGGLDIVTAGAGGGCADNTGDVGGAATFSGTSGIGPNPGLSGGGGTQTAGGAGVGGGTAGSLGLGGNAAGNAGAGGSGYYGGGGSSYDQGQGGAGSSFIDNLNLIPGQSVFGYNGAQPAAPNTTSPFYQTGVAAGGTTAGQRAGDGLVVVVFAYAYKASPSLPPYPTPGTPSIPNWVVYTLDANATIYIGTSSDGLSWSWTTPFSFPGTAPDTTWSKQWISVNPSRTRCLIAGGFNGSVQETSDMQTWSSDTNSIYYIAFAVNGDYGNGVWVVNGYGARLMVSLDDGRTYTNLEVPGMAGNGFSIAYNPTTHTMCACGGQGGAGYIVRSSYPFAVGTWKKVVSGTNVDYLRSLAYGNGLWICICDIGQFYSTDDGLSWTYVDTGLLANQVYFARYNNTFYLTTRDGLFFSTTDGIELVTISLPYSGLRTMATDGVTFVMQTRYTPLIATSFPPTSSSEWTPIEVPFALPGYSCGIIYVE